MTTFVLIHGSWHGGWCWTSVVRRLAEKGHAAHAPTMTGHGVTDDRAGVTNQHCADALVDYIERRDLREVVLVGHSWAGTLLSTVTPRVLDRVHGLVYASAFVLEPGECQLDVLPPELVGVFAQLAEQAPDRTVPPPPFDFWQHAMMQDAGEAAQRLAHSLLSPTPFGCWESKIDIAARDLDVPKSYVTSNDDIALTGDFAWCPRFPERLGEHRLIETAGSHEACFTRPVELADAILAASEPS